MKKQTEALNKNIENLQSTSASYKEIFTQEQANQKTEFSDSQTSRAEEFSEFKIKYTEEIEKNIQNMKKLASDERTETTNKHEQNFTELFKSTKENIEKEKTDGVAYIQEMRKNVGDIYKLFGEESVATGYLNSAVDEKKVADKWRLISLGFYGGMILWVILDVLFFYFGHINQIIQRFLNDTSGYS